jgi:hypothetical protein
VFFQKPVNKTSWRDDHCRSTSLPKAKLGCDLTAVRGAESTNAHAVLQSFQRTFLNPSASVLGWDMGPTGEDQTAAALCMDCRAGSWGLSHLLKAEGLGLGLYMERRVDRIVDLP